MMQMPSFKVLICKVSLNSELVANCDLNDLSVLSNAILICKLFSRILKSRFKAGFTLGSMWWWICESLSWNSLLSYVELNAQTDFQRNLCAQLLHLWSYPLHIEGKQKTGEKSEGRERQQFAQGQREGGSQGRAPPSQLQPHAPGAGHELPPSLIVSNRDLPRLCKLAACASAAGHLRRRIQDHVVFSL